MPAHVPKDAAAAGPAEPVPPPRVIDQRRLPRIEPEPEPTGWRRWWTRAGRRDSSGLAASLVFHSVLLAALGMLVQASLPESDLLAMLASANQPGPLDAPAGAFDSETAMIGGYDPVIGAAMADARRELPELADLQRPSIPLADAIELPLTGIVTGLLEPADWSPDRDADVRGALKGRGREGRAALAALDGGSPQSEAAVERGLRWLVAHQRDDGSWNFDHTGGACRNLCRNPGTESSTTAATAIVLLPFLGAGYTHLDGEYRDVVDRGLYYLSKRAHLTRDGADLQEGTMYAQGLCGIALCEALAMTEDASLRDLAWETIRFIVHAQDRKGGGWRYAPGEPGDTTVTGWQLMALKSGQMALLDVPSPPMSAAVRFLNSVECDSGARYGYMTPQPRNTTTAIGLLCRMYTGWPRTHPALGRGVAYLSQWGPSEDNLYYDYYATQVLHHWGGPEWNEWNRRMRDHLIDTQATEGHEAGSWYFSGGQGNVGGRLYNTAMAVMILEVYYRYMPLYRDEAVTSGF